MRRKRWRIALSATLLLAASIYLVASFFPFRSTAERMIVSYFARHGTQVESVTVERYTDSTLVIRDLALAQGLTLKGLTLNYRLKELLEGQVPSIELEGLELTLKQTEQGAWQIPALQNLLAALRAESAPLPLLQKIPFDRLAAKNVTLHIQQGAQVWTLHSEAVTLEREATGLAATIGQLSHRHATPVFPAFSAAVTLKEAGERLVMDGTAKGVTHASVAFLLSGELDRYGAPKQFRAEGKPITFTPAFQPAQLSSFAAKLPQVTGSLRPLLTLGFENGAVKPLLQLALKDGAIAQGASQAEGINGTLTFDSLAPLATKGTQSLSVAKLMAGLPLEKGEVRFRLSKDGTLTILPTAWQWSGGTLGTAEQRFNLKDFRLERITLNVKDVPLVALLTMALKEGLSAEGTVSGALPVYLKGGKILIENGTLSASENGVIRYFPSASSPLQKGQGGTDLLLSALENFHFHSMVLTANSEREDLVRLTLQIKGNNPDLYGGKPIELNIVLTGDVFGLAESGLKAYRLPETLEETINAPTR